MKKIYLLGAVLFSAISFGQFTEVFPGTGSLNANGWTTHSGTAGQLTISTGSLSYSGLSPDTGNKIALRYPDSEDVNRSVGTAITGTAYFSAVLNVPNTNDLLVTGDYSMALSATIGTTGVTAFFGRLYIKPGTAPSTFNVGTVNASGTGSTPTYISSDLPVGTPVFIVVKYDRGTNTSSLFLNPALDTTEPPANITNNSGATAAPAQIAGLIIRQSGNTTTPTLGTGYVEYDNIRVADNWAYVTTGTLSAKDFENISGLRMYPNPAKNALNIASDSFATKNVEIYTMLGAKVLANEVVNGTVNIASLAKGLYVVKITEEGKTATRELVVE